MNVEHVELETVPVRCRHRTGFWLQSRRVAEINPGRREAAHVETIGAVDPNGRTIRRHLDPADLFGVFHAGTVSSAVTAMTSENSMVAPTPGRCRVSECMPRRAFSA